MVYHQFSIYREHIGI